MHVAVKNQKYSMIKIVQTDLCKGQIKSSYKGQGGKDTQSIRPRKKQSPLLEMAGKLTWEMSWEDLGNVFSSGALGS